MLNSNGDKFVYQYKIQLFLILFILQNITEVNKEQVVRRKEILLGLKSGYNKRRGSP